MNALCQFLYVPPSNIPLLHCKRLIVRYPKTNHLDLGVEAIEVNVGNDPQRAGCGAGGELGQVAIGKARSPRASGAGRRRVPEESARR